MKTLGYYNGRFDEIENMSIPMNDRACCFGDGVYDAGPCVDYKIFAMDEHVDRFYRSAAMLRIEIPMEKQELKDLLNDLVKKMDTGDLFVYYQVSRGTAPRNHVFPDTKTTKANLWITLTPSVLSDCTSPLKLITTEDTRFFHCNIKTINLIPAVMAAQKAKEAGCDEAVLIRPGDRVTECAHSNVHILKDGILYTAPTDNLILPGIARAHLLGACQSLGIKVSETPFTRERLLDADEILITSSGKPCMRAMSVDGLAAGMKDEERFQALRKYILDEISNYCR